MKGLPLWKWKNGPAPAPLSTIIQEAIPSLGTGGMSLIQKWMKMVSTKSSIFGWFLDLIQKSSIFGWLLFICLYRETNVIYNHPIMDVFEHPIIYDSINHPTMDMILIISLWCGSHTVYLEAAIQALGSAICGLLHGSISSNSAVLYTSLSLHP